MSNFTEATVGNCRWCLGEGPSFYGDYTSGSEAWFKCLSCGQSHKADGDCLEDAYANGGFGVLICKPVSDRYPAARILWESNGIEPYVVYQLGENEIVNTSLRDKLKACSEWVLRTSYDRNSATETTHSRFDLTKVRRDTVAEFGVPPWRDELRHQLLEGYLAPDDQS